MANETVRVTHKRVTLRLWEGEEDDRSIREQVRRKRIRLSGALISAGDVARFRMGRIPCICSVCVDGHIA